MADRQKIGRLDARLKTEGFASSLEEGQQLILSGRVSVQGQIVTSLSAQVKAGVSLRVAPPPKAQWVSRGAFKLLTAIEGFGLSLQNRICLDVGASTGGFTQVMVRHGAKKVYALDVGYGQLAWELQQHSAVVVMDRRNARLMEPTDFVPPPDFAASDASFISLRHLLNPVDRVLTEAGEAVVLVKPQFEVERHLIGAGGIVTDPQVHVETLEDLACFVARETSFGLLGALWSSIRGTKGNIEFLFHLKKGVPSVMIDMERLVTQAHEAMTGPQGRSESDDAGTDC